ncbi:MAG: YihY/virulence factor BrkB family protein [Sphaerobacteraceae bacterium]|nr:MAG: YihY/virulence factor BrkB family protein [Sphaerobacteraceae bacterium]
MKDKVTILAGDAAFRLILSLPPLVIFFASLSAVINRHTGWDIFGWVETQIEDAPVPAEAEEMLSMILETAEEQGGAGLLSIGIVVALWSASNAIGTMMQAFNIAYNTEESRGFIWQKVIAVGLTIALSLLVISSFILFVFGQAIGSAIAELAGLGGTFELIWNIVRWPVLILMFMVALSVLYWKGPSMNQSFRWISPGAILATIVWLIAVWGFSLYLQFADPGSAYGALGGMVVLLMFLYMSSIVVMAGAELNAVLDRHYDPAVVSTKASEPEHQMDPLSSQERAQEMAEREGKPAEDYGVTPDSERRARERVEEDLG